MGRIVVELDEELEKAFRDEVAKRLGMKKGNIKIAIEEAMQNWIDRGYMYLIVLFIPTFLYDKVGGLLSAI